MLTQTLQKLEKEFMASEKKISKLVAKTENANVESLISTNNNQYH